MRGVIQKPSAVGLVLLLICLGTSFGDKKDKSETTARVLTGKVTDREDNPLPDAVVYLTDTRSHGVKTYIVGKDGGYRFPALSLNIDYEVYAQFKGHKSDTKTVSQFDNRLQVTINLRIDTR